MWCDVPAKLTKQLIENHHQIIISPLEKESMMITSCLLTDNVPFSRVVELSRYRYLF